MSAHQVPWRNAWVIVLSASGETLDSFFADRAGFGCTRRSASAFGPALVKAIQKALSRHTSLQKLERRYRSDHKNSLALCCWLDRLLDFQRGAAVKQICTARNDTAFSPAIKDTMDLYSYIAEHEYCCGGPKLQGSLQLGEDLLTRMPNHPRIAMVRHYLRYYLTCGFDVPTRLKNCIARLQSRVSESHHAKSFLRQIRRFEREMTEVIARSQQYASKDKRLSLHSAGFLGDARTVIKELSKPENKEREEQLWLDDARRKLAQTALTPR